MTIYSHEVYLDVVKALDQAEEIGFERESYVRLMDEVIEEALRRRDVFLNPSRPVEVVLELLTKPDADPKYTIGDILVPEGCFEMFVNGRRFSIAVTEDLA